jgi:hypothetical protein
VTAGPHTDPKEVANSTLPVIRTTLSITSQFNATLSSIWIVKGSSVVSLSGFLNVQPSTPTISNVLDAESAQSLITSGQYGAIYGANLASTTRSWDSTIDFTGGVAAGSPLPPFLDGVSVTVNSVPAAVYFVCSVCSPNQINFIVPSNLTPGPASVVVTNAGTLSAAFTSSTIAQASPSFFIYSAGGTYYPVAVHVGGALVGDPAAQSNATKAHPGEITGECGRNGDHVYGSDDDDGRHLQHQRAGRRACLCGRIPGQRAVAGEYTAGQLHAYDECSERIDRFERYHRHPACRVINGVLSAAPPLQ